MGNRVMPITTEKAQNFGSDTLRIFNSNELGISVRTILNEDGSISINAEDTARGFGWTTVARSGNEVVRWARVNEYCKEFGFPSKLGKDDYIPESLFYRLGMKANNPAADKFQNWLALEVIPSIRKHGAYSTDQTISKIIDNPDFGIELLTKLKSERAARITAEEEKKALQEQLDMSKDWYSIKRVAAMNGVDWKTFDWRILKEKGLQMGYSVKKIFDANYGEVNTYHREVWEAVYPEYEI